jgi:hypothetical protein
MVLDQAHGYILLHMRSSVDLFKAFASPYYGQTSKSLNDTCDPAAAMGNISLCPQMAAPMLANAATATL